MFRNLRRDLACAAFLQKRLPIPRWIAGHSMNGPTLLLVSIWPISYCCRSRLREAGILVRPRDSSALAHGLRRMLEDGAGRPRMAAGALALVRTMSWTRTAEQTLSVYRRAIADSRQIR